jgi:hypothetical protein
MRKVGMVVLLAFAVTLAVVVGQRMSAEAMAVMVGVVCGVAAGIPTGFLLLLVWTPRERSVDQTAHGPSERSWGSSPPVVVIQGGNPATTWPGASALFYGNAPLETAPRSFHVVGEEE